MTASNPLLDRGAITAALRRLGDRLARRGVVADIYVFGGAGARHSSSRNRHRGGRVVAAELGLPPWWLNEQASAYVTPGRDPSAPEVFDHPGLRVAAASPEHLLAMKVHAARRRDIEDVRILVRHLGLRSTQEALDLCAEVFPDEPVPARAQLVLEDAFGTAADEDSSH